MTRQQCRAALDFPRAEGHWPAPKRRRVPVGPGGAARFGAADLSGPSPQSISVKERRSEEHTSELQSLMCITYAVFYLTEQNNLQPYTDTILTVQIHILITILTTSI